MLLVDTQRTHILRSVIETNDALGGGVDRMRLPGDEMVLGILCQCLFHATNWRRSVRVRGRRCEQTSAQLLYLDARDQLDVVGLDLALGDPLRVGALLLVAQDRCRTRTKRHAAKEHKLVSRVNVHRARVVVLERDAIRGLDQTNTNTNT